MYIISEVNYASKLCLNLCTLNTSSVLVNIYTTIHDFHIKSNYGTFVNYRLNRSMNPQLLPSDTNVESLRIVAKGRSCLLYDWLHIWKEKQALWEGKTYFENIYNYTVVEVNSIYKIFTKINLSVI